MATGADYEVVDVSSGEEITNPGANDVMVAFHKSTGALEKIDYNKLAKAIIEQYTGSTIGGVAQSVKAALDTVSNATIVKNMPSSMDFNNYTETSVWRCDLLETNVTNGPSVGTYVSGFLFVYKYDPRYLMQRFCFSGTGSSKYDWIRFNWIGTWSDWVKQPTRDELNVVSVNTGIKGLYAFKMGNIVWIRVDDCAYNITGTVPKSLKPRNGVHFCAISGNADRKNALFSINAAGEVDVSSQITSGYIYGSTVYMT